MSRSESEQMIDDLNSLTSEINRLIEKFEKKYPVCVKDVELYHGIYSERRNFTKDVNLTVELNKLHQSDL